MDRRDKLIKTNIIKYGSYENYVKHLREIGSEGGKKSPGPFTDKSLASRAGLISAKNRRERENMNREDT